jgi:hypothetical protein
MDIPATIESFLKTESNGAIILLGPSMGGKTQICTNALKNTHFLNVQYEIFENHNDLVKTVTNFIDLKSISNDGSLQSRSNIILFDDIDILISQNRYAISFIISCLKKCKLLITCINSEEKKLTELKKHCKNILRIVHKKHVSSEHEKYFNMNIYQVVENVLDNYKCGLSDIEIAISSDPTLVGFMMYDNYKAYFTKVYKNIPLSIHETISKAYTYSTNIEDYGFHLCDNNLIDISNIIRCFTIRIIQQNLTEKKTKSKSGETIIYTQINARSAQHCNVKKKQSRIDEMTPANIAMYAMICHTNKTKMDLKTDIGSVCQSYIYNICKIK